MLEKNHSIADAGLSRPGSWSASAQAPRVLLVVAIAVSVTPLLLNLFGVDFGSERHELNVSLVTGGAPAAQLDDAMHYALSGSFSHTILEWSAFCAAIFTVVLAFVHYKIKRDVTLPIIGVALFCAGSMDAFHTLAADRLIEAVADNRNLIPFTWAICRVFTSGSCCSASGCSPATPPAAAGQLLVHHRSERRLRAHRVPDHPLLRDQRQPASDDVPRRADQAAVRRSAPGAVGLRGHRRLLAFLPSAAVDLQLRAAGEPDPGYRRAAAHGVRLQRPVRQPFQRRALPEDRRLRDPADRAVPGVHSNPQGRAGRPASPGIGAAKTAGAS